MYFYVGIYVYYYFIYSCVSVFILRYSSAPHQMEELEAIFERRSISYATIVK